MEYTKDIVLDIKYKGEGRKSIIKNWTREMLNVIKMNKFIISVIVTTIIFMMIDIVLVNNFISLLSKI